jgi:hypothetical protein
MALMGQITLRTGDSIGGAGYLPGPWNSAPGSQHPFSLYYCQQCGKFDLYYVGT